MKSALRFNFATVQVVLLLLLTPLAVTATTTTGWVLLLIPALWLVRLFAHGRLVPRTPANAGLWLMLFMIGVSLWATYDVALSIEKVAALIHGIALYWAVIDFADSRPRLTTAVLAYTATGWGVVTLGILFTRWPAKLPGLGTIANFLNRNQPQVPFTIADINPNQIGGTLIWIVPMVAVLTSALLIRSRDAHGRFGRFYYFIAPYGMVTAIVTGLLFLVAQSRGSYLGMAIAVPLMVLLAVPVRYRRGLLLTAALFVLLAVTVVFAVGPQQAVGLLFDTAEVNLSAFNERGVGTLDGRLEIWSRALYGIQDFPFTGMGMNTFREVVHILYPLFLISPTTDIAHAHNHLLQTALGLGIPGLIGYLSVWFATAVMLWQTWRHTADFWHRALVVGTAGSLTAYWVYGITDAVALGAKPGFIFWFLLALVAANHNIVRQAATEPQPK